MENRDYNFHQCVEHFFYKQHECQYPWYSNEKFGIPICSNLTVLKDLINLHNRDNGMDRDLYSNLQRIKYTKHGCQMPCEIVRYMLKYENNEEEMGMDKYRETKEATDKYSLVISYENFMIERREEFAACDRNCIIGELGGNLGFFLGGSILAFFDVVIIHFSKLPNLIR